MRCDLNDNTNRVRDWLLNVPLVIQDNSGACAVAGWVEAQGSIPFLYPEIGGYYLAFLSSLIIAKDDQSALAQQRLRGVLQWLDRISAGAQLPRGRYHCRPEYNDWRSEFAFAFDIGIILRGLSAATLTSVESKLVADLSSRYSRLLEKFITPEGDFRALIPFVEHTLPPVSSWSTAIGPYQLKSLSFGPADRKHLPAKALTDTIAQFCKPGIPWESHRQTHPCLYYIEGLLIAGSQSNNSTAMNIARDGLNFLAGIFSKQGYLGESLCGSEQIIRSDVQAQFLRAVTIAKILGHESTAGNELIPEAANLCAEFVQPSGAVTFCRPAEGRPKIYNTWCAMFCWQALRFKDQDSGSPILKYWPILLI